MTFKYSSIDDQIVSEALGGEPNVVDVEARVVGEKPRRKNKTKAAATALVGVVLLIGAAGAYLNKNSVPDVSPELAALIAGAPRAPAVDSRLQEGEPILNDQAPQPGVMGSADAPVMFAAVDTPSQATVVAQSVEPVQAPAPTVAAVVHPDAPPAGKLAVVSAEAEVAKADERLHKQASELEKLDKAVGARKAELDALKGEIALAQKTKSELLAKNSASSVNAPAPKAKAADAPKASKNSSAKASAKSVDKSPVRVAALLSDGVVLSDGHVIEVGAASPRIGGKLTGVSPLGGVIEVNGEARNVVVDPS